MIEKGISAALRFKVVLLDRWIDGLPPEVGAPLRQAEQVLLKAVHEATAPSAEPAGPSKAKPTDGGGVQPIRID